MGGTFCCLVNASNSCCYVLQPSSCCEIKFTSHVSKAIDDSHLYIINHGMSM